jgi:hypothetical protein
MKKLRLNLDALAVETFQTDNADGPTGTVEGYVSTQCTGGVLTCNGGNTCVAGGATCGGAETCLTNCYGSCVVCEPAYDTDGCGLETSVYAGCPGTASVFEPNC